MSDQQRRHDDDLPEHERRLYNLVCSKQFDELKAETRNLADQVGELNKKVFNGFETKIEKTALAVEHTDEKVEQMRKDDEAAHAEIKGSIITLNKWLVRILVSLVIVLISVGGSMVLSQVQHLEIKHATSTESP